MPSSSSSVGNAYSFQELLCRLGEEHDREVSGLRQQVADLKAKLGTFGIPEDDCAPAAGSDETIVTFGRPGSKISAAAPNGEPTYKAGQSSDPVLNISKTDDYGDSQKTLSAHRSGSDESVGAATPPTLPVNISVAACERQNAETPGPNDSLLSSDRVCMSSQIDDYGDSQRTNQDSDTDFREVPISEAPSESSPKPSEEACVEFHPVVPRGPQSSCCSDKAPSPSASQSSLSPRQFRSRLAVTRQRPEPAASASVEQQPEIPGQTVQSEARMLLDARQQKAQCAITVQESTVSTPVHGHSFESESSMIPEVGSFKCQGTEWDPRKMRSPSAVLEGVSVEGPQARRKLQRSPSVNSWVSGVTPRSQSKANLMEKIGQTRRSSLQAADALEMQTEWISRLSELRNFGMPDIDGRCFNSPLANTNSKNMLRRTRSKLNFGKSWWQTFLSSPVLSSPDSALRLCWDFSCVGLLAYDLATVPLQVFDINENPFTFFIRWLMFVFWTIDIIASFFVGYHSKGVVILDIRKIAKHYLTSWFFFDLGLVSIDGVLLILSMTGAASTESLVSLGRTAPVLRGLRLLRLMKFQVMLSDFVMLVRSERTRTLLSILRLVCFIVATNHVVACTFYGLHYLKPSSGKSWVGQHFGTEDAVLYRYSTSLHWSLTQFTPASMEVQPVNTLERCFTVCVLLFALVTFSSFVSSITAAMTYLRSINAKKLSEERTLRRYLADHGISNQLTSRVLHYFAERAGQQKHRQMRTLEQDVVLFQVLPETTKMELRVEAFTPILTLHPLFEQLNVFDHEFVQEVCRAAVAEKQMLVRDELWGHGAKVTHMIFVIYGVLGYSYQINGMKVKDVVVSRQWACEHALWATNTERTLPFVAESNCELTLLNAQAFSAVAARYPHAAAALAVYCEQFVEEAKEVEKQAEAQVAVSLTKDACLEIMHKTFDVVDSYMSERDPDFDFVRVHQRLSSVPSSAMQRCARPHGSGTFANISSTVRSLFARRESLGTGRPSN